MWSLCNVSHSLLWRRRGGGEEGGEGLFGEGEMGYLASFNALN